MHPPPSLQEQILAAVVVVLVLIYLIHDVAKLTISNNDERRQFSKMKALAKQHEAPSVSVTPAWFVLGVPSMLQSKFSYAKHFAPGVLVLTGQTLKLFDSSDQKKFECQVEGRQITYGQVGGEFLVEIDGMDYVISLAGSVLSPALFTAKAMRWKRLLAAAGADITTKSAISRHP